jgi:hypothetical protein
MNIVINWIAHIALVGAIAFFLFVLAGICGAWK